MPNWLRLGVRWFSGYLQPLNAKGGVMERWDNEEHFWITLPLAELEEGLIQRVLAKDLQRSKLAIKRLTRMAGHTPTARGLFLLARLLAMLREYSELQTVLEQLAQDFPESPEEAFARGFYFESLILSAQTSGEQDRLSYEAYVAYRDAWQRAPHDPYSEEAFVKFMRRWQERRKLGPKPGKPCGRIDSWKEFKSRERQAI
ncbi:hypothetical protein HY629_02635 [Candidatus Uhrbacteria bacterium]|nr:hypothetical protein [Candidatus Uhrbacteria bacterium]